MASAYFWRTCTGAKLDYVEEADGQLAGFGFTFSKKPAKAPATWASTYPQATFAAVNRDSYLDFAL